MAWTDERLDDLAERMDAGFARTDRELLALRGEIAGLRTEVKGDVSSLHSLIIRFGVSILLCLVTVIAAMVGVILTVPPGA